MIQFNALLIAYLSIFIFRSLFQAALNILNINHLNQDGNEVPRVFRNAVDKDKFSIMARYTSDSTKFEIISQVSDQILMLLILLSGFLPWLVELINTCCSDFISGGLLFFATLAFISTLFDVPFSLYHTFVIEERYGFNTKTVKLWILDWLKGIALSIILGGIFLFFLLLLLRYMENYWWFFAWIILSVFELIIMWLYPVLIAPIFNKFEPISNEELKDKIVNLMSKAGLGVKGIFQMDAGIRSKHTNAYFTGLGKTKRIVLFDTLLKSHPDDEILSILAHETGHWIKKHIIKQLILMEAMSFIGLFIIAKLLDWHHIYQTFGFEGKIPYAGLFLVPVLLAPIGYFLSPAGSAISRKYEKEADTVAVSLTGDAEPMISALIKLSAENLSNLVPHKIYSWFNYSHPAPVDRIERLEAMKNNL
ncbi:MAG: M48 family metallopeptidase [Thermodesulfobacteriota bacterium]|nr:M48 family metallopeptidase [Thermodesulfobacteriota bacterium]